jgi:hypothetical protein
VIAATGYKADSGGYTEMKQKTPFKRQTFLSAKKLLY